MFFKKIKKIKKSYCLWKLFFDSKSSQIPTNVIYFDVLGNSKTFNTVLI